MYKNHGGRRGGARPGAGRKKGGHNRIPSNVLEAKQQLNEFVLSQWETLLTVKMEAASGEIYVGVEDANSGIKKVYKREPDQRAATELIEFVTGKAVAHVDAKIDGTIDSPLMNELALGIRDILNGNKQSQTTQNVPLQPADSASQKSVSQNG